MNRRHFENLDWILLLTVLMLSVLGIITIYSVTCGDSGLQDYKKQIFWVAIGFMVMIGIMSFDYGTLVKNSPLIYGATIVLLIYILLAPAELGVHRWIQLGRFRLQPSEFAKLSVILILARWMARWRSTEPALKNLFPPSILVAIPFLLILMEPDLGTSLVLGPIFIALIFTSGFSFKKMVIFALLIIVPAVLVAPHVLKPYQMRRITSFLHPENDPLGSGYHLIQSQIAIGSGGLSGKGFKSGTQSHLNFLPVQDTDFIFAVWAEERGFAGAFLLIALFALLLYRSLRIARQARDLPGSYICVGLTVMLFCQILVNIGMVIGLMPITGLPLPFMSYGGSACLTNFFSMGLILNIGMRKFADYSK